jgi:hypothetical protein
MTTYLRVINGSHSSWWNPERWSYQQPKKSIEQIKQEWTELFNAANPPPETGIFALSFTDLIGAMEPNRYPLQGGPLDGLGIAKFIEVKKGRGKNQLVVLVPLDPDWFQVNGKLYKRTADDKTDETTGYQYEEDDIA